MTKCKNCNKCSCKTIVWTNGCFDILHYGHLKMLEYAKSLGDYLIVGIDSDIKVREDKGIDRPVFSEHIRKYMLESLKMVDEVVVFNNKQALENNIQYYKPDVMVVGSDWKDKDVVGAKWAGRVEFFSRIEGYSTTQIIERVGYLMPKGRIKR